MVHYITQHIYLSTNLAYGYLHICFKLLLNFHFVTDYRTAVPQKLGNLEQNLGAVSHAHEALKIGVGALAVGILQLAHSVFPSRNCCC